VKVVYPHMGYRWICIKAMLEYLDVEVVVPPPCSKKTLLLGVKHAPEFACLPLKLNLGNFMEAAELGADTIVMAGGCGPCRFGYYAQIEHAILQDLGYQYDLVVLEPPQKHLGELLNKIKYITGHKSLRQIISGIRFGYRKAEAVDKLEKTALYCRPRETKAGATDRALQHALQEIIAVAEPAYLPHALKRAVEIMNAVPLDKYRPVLRIGLVGEIYTLLEPFTNQDMERKLGSMGVEVDRSIYLSEWINEHLLLGLVKNTRNSKLVRQKAAKYLRHFVGGHGLETVGSTVLYAEQGYDGVIQLLPFTCMPEIVAQSILPRVSTELGIPTMTLIVDEQSGEAGLVTRLEAFVDLLARRKQAGEVLA